MVEPNLTAALLDGVALLGTQSPSNAANSLETILKTRLSVYYTRLSQHVALEHLNNLSALTDLQFLTAKEAFSVVERVQKVLGSEPHEPPPGKDELLSKVPSIGIRDLASLRTLLSLVFKWGTDALFARVSQTWSTVAMDKRRGSNVPDLTLESGDYQLLATLLMSLFSLVFPDGAQGRISQTLITTTILSRHVKDILLPALGLGWLPESLSTPSMPPVHDARPLVMRLMRLLIPAQTMASLVAILSLNTIPLPIHVRKACASLLTQQLLRPDGVQGLCEAMFSEEEANGDEASIEKLEQIAYTLNSMPATMKKEDYFQTILPRVFKLLITETRTSYRRAAAFIIYRGVMPLKRRQHSAYASETILISLHKPFLEFSDAQRQNSDHFFLEAWSALLSLTVLLSNTEPSPAFISKLLSPIIPSLYLLSYDLERFKTADPRLRESVTGLLLSWGKIVDEDEGTRILSSVVEGGKDGDWKFNLEGQFWKSKSLQERSEPSLLLPVDEPAMAKNIDINLFDLYPDPVHFVEFLKLLEREDIASNIFLQLLESYQDMKQRSSDDPMKALLKLQIVTQIQKRLSEGTTSNILRKPAHFLSFIFRVFESASLALEGGSLGGTKTTQEAAPRTAEILDDVDSDDEATGSEVIGPDDELIETATTLLLSILENETLTAHSHPIFNEIFSILEPLAIRGSSATRPLAREARLVITAKLANTSQARTRTTTTKKESADDLQERYQKALKLLQDPILPVRAHGLLLLRQLVSPAFGKTHQVNKALVPSILSIFLQSVQDEDSYIFLSAVQGLSSLVDIFGKEILQGLVRDYAGGLAGLGAGNLSQRDLDIRTRIGEAMSSVIKRCGSALGIYVDMLAPPLFAVVRGSNIPNPLRTSSLSLLADCVNTYPLAMLPYLDDISQSLIDLLQIESVPLKDGRLQSASSDAPDTNPAAPDHKNEQNEGGNLTMDANPLLMNPRTPLRRAALHFLSILIKASTKLTYEETTINPTLFSPGVFQRLSITLGYISSTDRDNVVQVMAREAKENLEQLQRAAFGL